MTRDFNALTVSHAFLETHVRPGAFCIDATAGRGNDTAYLCALAGERGRVLAFDIQQEALDSTARLLATRGLTDRAQLILDSHSNLAAYAAPETVDCVVFNFGWLPAGSHTIFTRPETSIPALDAAMRLLKPDGVISLCIYYGKESGYTERDALLEYLTTIDSQRYSVLVSQFVNRPHCPAIPAFILREPD